MAGNIEDIDKWDDVSQIETAATGTQLSDDTGYGKKAIIRMFEFKANAKAFKAHTPTKQELLYYHQGGIEAQLWADGFKVMPEVPPRISISKNKKKYAIFIGAEPRNGMAILEQPKTLTQIANNL